MAASAELRPGPGGAPSIESSPEGEAGLLGLIQGQPPGPALLSSSTQLGSSMSYQPPSSGPGPYGPSPSGLPPVQDSIHALSKVSPESWWLLLLLNLILIKWRLNFQ